MNPRRPGAAQENESSTQNTCCLNIVSRGEGSSLGNGKLVYGCVGCRGHVFGPVPRCSCEAAPRPTTPNESHTALPRTHARSSSRAFNLAYPVVIITWPTCRLSATSRRLSILLPQLSWSTSCAPLPRRLLHVRPPRLLSSPGGSGLGSGRRAGVPATNSKSARRRRAPASLPNARVVLYKGPPAETLPRETVWWITSAQSSAVWRRAPGATLAAIWNTGKPP